MLPNEYNKANLKGLPVTTLRKDPKDISWIKYPIFETDLPMTQQTAKPINL
jgi:hypothetical protein